MIKLNLKAESIKILEDNTGKKFCHLGISKDCFLGRKYKAQSIKNI